MTIIDQPYPASYVVSFDQLGLLPLRFPIDDQPELRERLTEAVRRYVQRTMRYRADDLEVWVNFEVERGFIHFGFWMGRVIPFTLAVSS